MKEFLRKLTSISTLAGIVLVVLAFFPRGNVAATVFLALFISSWAALKLLLWGWEKGNASAKSPASAKKRNVRTAAAKKAVTLHGTHVQRSDGSDFEIPDVDDEEELDENDPQQLLLDFVNGHVTDLLQSYYPGASWKWLCAEPLQQIVTGGVARIRLLSVADYTYADISFADPKKLDIQMIRTDPLVRPVKAPATIPDPVVSAPMAAAPAVQPASIVSKPQETDVKVWYSLIGQHALEQIITDLNVRGCRKLTIDESGAVYATEEGKAPTKELTLDRMPAKSYWDELKVLLSEQELTATVEQNQLVIGW